MGDKRFKVIIKSPSDKIPSLTVQCLSHWLASDLKNYLSEHHPAQPSVSSQRLIHAGKLLKDDTSISDICSQVDGLPTIHLVYPNPRPMGDSNVNNQRGDNTLFDISPEQMHKYQQAYYHYLQTFYMENPPVNRTEYRTQDYRCPIDFGSGTVIQMLPGNYSFPNNAYVPQTHSSSHQAIPNSSSSNTQQWIQRAQALLSGWGVFNGNRRQREAGEVLPNEDGVNQRADQIQPQAAQEVFNNAIRNNDRPDEEVNGVGNMDIIDRFYLLFRLCLFVGLCFAYSSLDKALIVFSVAAYVYLYNIYRRYAVVERIVQAQRRPQQNPQGTQSNLNTPASEQSENQQSQLAQESTDQANGSLRGEQESRFTRITTNLRLAANLSYQFFSALISSIIPEQPPPLHLD
ncbi:unnamed protein product [Schistosoma haematobium]|uniref:Homocysteine-responsive endoplasmic reticulum-resident ubiquitin-like domain member 2 protein n=2 Tax=Schistosoma haematobium TaxID=6185 RepID=A0A095C684_SCHHA|nr:unnamed protein product [Schistosoma haematobium]CAH8664388.1 unnamed protein product [Schistosoma haematobium]